MMLEEARARRVRETKNAPRAVTSGPHSTHPHDLKKLSSAAEKERNESPTASGGLTGPTLRRGRPGETKHDVQRLVRSGPVLADDLRARSARERAQREGEQDGVVELARDRDEVGHEIDRRGQVG